LYRIIGELITNTLRHASASKVEISLYNYEGKIELFYSDNGIGFETKKIKTNGMGLSNINSRVKSLDGEMEINSMNNQGVFIKISLTL